MVLLLRKYKNLKHYITYSFLFISYTFLLGGISFGIISMLKIDYTMSGVLFFSFEFPVSIFILLIYITIKLVKKISKKVTKDVSVSKYLYPIKIFSKNACVECIGFYDSGNRVAVDGRGVNIISLDVFMGLYKDISVGRLLCRDIGNLGLRNAKYIEIDGIRKNGSYLSFDVDKMIIEDIEYTDICVAVSFKNFTKFDCILSGSIFEN